MLLNQLSRALYEIRSTKKTNIYIYIYIHSFGWDFKNIYISFVPLGETKEKTKGTYTYIYFWNVNVFVNECVCIYIYIYILLFILLFPRGECRGGVCKTFCEAKGLQPCKCSSDEDACKVCCQQGDTCIPYRTNDTGGTLNIMNGRSCQGEDVQGTCVEVIFDSIIMAGKKISRHFFDQSEVIPVHDLRTDCIVWSTMHCNLSLQFILRNLIIPKVSGIHAIPCLSHVGYLWENNSRFGGEILDISHNAGQQYSG